MVIKDFLEIIKYFFVKNKLIGFILLFISRSFTILLILYVKKSKIKKVIVKNIT